MADDKGIAYLERAVRSLPLNPRDRYLICVKTMLKIVGNIIKNPADTKFHSLRVSNKTIQVKIAQVRGAVDFLRAHGFAQVEREGATYLELAAVGEAEVALLRKAEDWLTKQARPPSPRGR